MVNMNIIFVEHFESIFCNNLSIFRLVCYQKLKMHILLKIQAFRSVA